VAQAVDEGVDDAMFAGEDGPGVSVEGFAFDTGGKDGGGAGEPGCAFTLAEGGGDDGSLAELGVEVEAGGEAIDGAGVVEVEKPSCMAWGTLGIPGPVSAAMSWSSSPAAVEERKRCPRPAWWRRFPASSTATSSARATA
jgi:hypothetical protein